MDMRDIPRNFTPKTIVRSSRRLRASLSEALTADQAAAIRNQLDIQEGVLTWPDHALHTFRREFTNEPVPRDIVWPVIARVEDRD